MYVGVYVCMYVLILTETSSGLQEWFIVELVSILLVYNAPPRVERSLKSIHHNEIEYIYINYIPFTGLILYYFTC